MQPIKIKRIPSTPTLILNAKKGLIEIKGRAVLEDHTRYYSGFLEELIKYVRNPNQKTYINIDLDYIDTRSLRILVKFFGIIDRINKLNKKVYIKWYYEKDDTDLEERIKEFQSYISSNIQYIAK